MNTLVATLLLRTVDNHSLVAGHAAGHSGRKAGLALTPCTVNKHPGISGRVEFRQYLLNSPAPAHKIKTRGHRDLLAISIQKFLQTVITGKLQTGFLTLGQYSPAIRAEE